MKFWALLALAASVAVQAFPLEDYKAQLHTRADNVRKHIGYRVVRKEPNDPEGNEAWDCLVTVDADEWDKWKKAYLPELFTFPEDEEKNPKTCKPQTLWYMRPDTKRNRNRFLEHVLPGSTADNTVLFSKVRYHEHLTQALLPPALIDTGKVYLTPCAERKTEASDKVGVMGPVDWGFVESLPGYGMGTYVRKG